VASAVLGIIEAIVFSTIYPALPPILVVPFVTSFIFAVTLTFCRKQWMIGIVSFILTAVIRGAFMPGQLMIPLYGLLFQGARAENAWSCRLAGFFGRSVASVKRSLLTFCIAAEKAIEVRKALHETNKVFEEITGYIPYALRPSALIGTIDESIRKIEEFRDVGVTDFVLVFPEFETERWLAEFAKSIMPSF